MFYTVVYPHPLFYKFVEYRNMYTCLLFQGHIFFLMARGFTWAMMFCWVVIFSARSDSFKLFQSICWLWLVRWLVGLVDTVATRWFICAQNMSTWFDPIPFCLFYQCNKAMLWLAHAWFVSLNRSLEWLFRSYGIMNAVYVGMFNARFPFLFTLLYLLPCIFRDWVQKHLSAMQSRRWQQGVIFNDRKLPSYLWILMSYSF